MGREAVNIDFVHMLIGYLTLLIPLYYFYYFRIDLIKPMFVSVFRMSIQLLIVGFYLETIFSIDSDIINTIWVLLMVVIGVYTTIKRASLKFRYFIIPLTLSLLTSIIIIDIILLGFVLRLEDVFTARYIIPISGMILGNAMNYNIVSLNTFFEGLIKDENLYYYLLINSGDRKSALAPFIRNAMKKALNPLLGTMMVMGLISLPGMMTGQILGGSLPTTAIKYQILIAVAIFSAGTLNLALSIIFSNRFVFDKFGRLNRDILK